MNGFGPNETNGGVQTNVFFFLPHGDFCLPQEKEIKTEIIYILIETSC